jgi:hypothetical protein
MPLNVTRGGLEPAEIINEATGERVKCMFNPFEYTLSKTNQWQLDPQKGQNVPRVRFTNGGSQILKLALTFDTTLDGSDVRIHTDKLWKMMMVVESQADPQSGMSQPPEVSFAWGRLYFKAVLTNMTQKFTLFKPDGTPLRCAVDVTLEQKIDVDDYRDQQPLQGITGAPRSAQAVEGSRLDNIAAELAEEGVDAIRRIAEENNIDNPLNIAPGRLLNI